MDFNKYTSSLPHISYGNYIIMLVKVKFLFCIQAQEHRTTVWHRRACVDIPPAIGFDDLRHTDWSAYDRK